MTDRIGRTAALTDIIFGVTTEFSTTNELVTAILHDERLIVSDWPVTLEGKPLTAAELDAAIRTVLLVPAPTVTPEIKILLEALACVYMPMAMHESRTRS